MNKYYNVRNKFGQFTKRSRFNRQNSPLNIVTGRLYAWKNIPVRVHGLTLDLAYVSSHKQLSGYVPKSELTKLPKDEVNKYLAYA